MEIDMNINDILQVLRDMITFLECLGDAQLPLTLENLREKLLVRSKNTLSVTMARASSPEPYLDMKSGPKSLLLTKSEADLEEYVGMEESQKRTQIHPRTHPHQDYYETFENNGSLRIASASSITNEYFKQSDDRDGGGQMLIGIYKNVSAMQIKSKCYKCGPLYRKEGKKLFLSESRACWIALVGSHLLIYRSERHNRPYAIYQIRGYRARPAPSMIPRDRQKSESAFEIYSPGNETLQFIARTPKEMDEWIAKICEIECCNESERKKATEAHEKKRRITIVESPSTDHSRSNEVTRHRDEKSIIVDNSTDKAELASNRNKVERKESTDERTPSLSAGIPRRLPSLPFDNEILTVSSYRATVDGDDDDDDDDIYHRIEDLRNETRYQNMVLPKEKQAGANDEKQKEAIAYDDIGSRNEKNERNDKMEEGKSCDAISSQETYDDIITLLRIDATRIEPKRNLDNDSSIEVSIVDGAIEKREEFYDDVESLIPRGRFAKDRVKIETSNKLQQKKSFLDRVLSRRESPSKESDKRERYRYKDKISLNPASSMVMEKMPTYDDVSDLTSKQDYEAGCLTDEGEELSEYNHPPPPRPIYQVKLLAEGQSKTQEFYDDVSAYQERHNKNPQQATRDSCSTEVNEAERNATYDTESETNAREETEHYQSPKSDLCIRDDENEQLYDDIALWADFTARQRDIVGKRETEDAKSVSLDKKAWNRFAVNRKSRVMSDFNCSTEPNKRGNNEESDEIEDSPENSGAIKRNTFQKLISRMENSLAKVSARSPSSLSTGKSSVSSNNS